MKLEKKAKPPLAKLLKVVGKKTQATETCPQEGYSRGDIREFTGLHRHAASINFNITASDGENVHSGTRERS
jgi:hypothetical protein